MIFNADKNAAPIFKERLLWLLLLAPFFFLLYGSANQITASYQHVPSFAFDWEMKIPFIPEMIAPYMSLDLFFGFSFLLPKTRAELQRHAMRLGFTIAISVLIFLLFPLQFSFDKPDVSGWLAPVFTLLQNDLPYNQLPSLHVSLSIVVGYMFLRHANWLLRGILLLWFGLTIVSILFVYQHHFIDIPTGLVIGWLAFYLYPVTARPRFPLWFVSPKHLGMALKYLVLAIIFTILAFNVTQIWILFAWLAASMLLLSTAYTVGFNNLSQKKRGQVSWLYRLLFWPYLLANHLTWLYWKGKVSAINQVDDALFIGMSLGRNNQQFLKKHNINTVIDLAPELNSRITNEVKYYSQPLLDLVIPDPQQLIEIINKIEQTSQTGKVLVHCKLGLSRSVLVACAWLISRGDNNKDAWEKLKKIQPLCTDKPYMHIALELYEAKLNQIAC